MSKSSKWVRGAAAMACSLSMAAATADVVTWTDWTSISGNTATGVMGGVNVTVVGSTTLNGVSLTGVGTNYWTEPSALDRPYTGGSISNAPTPAEQVGLNTANRITVTFSSAVNSLYMALLSVGQAGVPVTYDFDRAFTIDSEGRGFWGNDTTDGVLGPNDTLTMREFHGVLHFNAPVTSMVFSTAPGENWHAFTFASGPAGNVPEPGSLALLGLGLFGLARARRAKR